MRYCSVDLAAPACDGHLVWRRSNSPSASRSIVLAILALGTACSLLNQGDWGVARAVIQGSAEDPVSLELPATITAGVATPVSLRTDGTRYCTRPSHTVVSTAGMVVTLEPYDSIYVGDLACPSVPCVCAHTVNITFPAAGVGTLRVMGRRGISLAVVVVDTVLNVQQ